VEKLRKALEKRTASFSVSASKKGIARQAGSSENVCAVSLKLVLSTVMNPQDFDTLLLHAIDSDVGQGRE
jgi:hypothetical protein